LVRALIGQVVTIIRGQIRGGAVQDVRQAVQGVVAVAKTSLAD